MESTLTKEVPVTSFKLLLGLTAGCLMALSLEPAVAADPKAEIDIRDEAGKVLIAADQIRSYEWATHTLTLVPKLRGQLAGQLRKGGRLVSGVPFTVVVGGKVVYKGTFTSVASSHSFSTPVIGIDRQMVDAKLKEDQLRIQLGYPTAKFFKGEDPRVDHRIKDALEAARKLAKTPAPASAETVRGGAAKESNSEDLRQDDADDKDESPPADLDETEVDANDTTSATGKPGSSAVENVAHIAQQVASGIEDLKAKYPNLGAFSAAKHLRKTPTHEGFAPRTPSNPELFSISYFNGVLGKKASPKTGLKRSVEFIYDPKIGVYLNIHFFKGNSRGADARRPYKIGDLSVHLYVQGPAADAIRTDIEPILDALRSKFRPNGLKPT